VNEIERIWEEFGVVKEQVRLLRMEVAGVKEQLDQIATMRRELEEMFWKEYGNFKEVSDRSWAKVDEKTELIKRQLMEAVGVKK
jgi:predicted nuclease with TOPRIM domain